MISFQFPLVLVTCSDVLVGNVSRSSTGVMANKIAEMDRTRRADVASTAADNLNTGVTTTSVSPSVPVPGVTDSFSVLMVRTSSRVRLTRARVMSGGAGRACVSPPSTGVTETFSVPTSVMRSSVGVARGRGRGSSGAGAGSAWTRGTGVTGRSSAWTGRMRRSVRHRIVPGSIRSALPHHTYLPPTHDITQGKCLVLLYHNGL